MLLCTVLVSFIYCAIYSFKLLARPLLSIMFVFAYDQEMYTLAYVYIWFVLYSFLKGKQLDNVGK